MSLSLVEMAMRASFEDLVGRTRFDQPPHHCVTTAQHPIRPATPPSCVHCIAIACNAVALMSPIPVQCRRTYELIPCLPGLPIAIRNRVRRYFELQWLATKGASQADQLYVPSLPRSMQIDVSIPRLA